MGLAELFGRRGVVQAALAQETGPLPQLDRSPRTTFAVGGDLATWQALVGNLSTSRISRIDAGSVPAVKRARDLICNGVAVLPLHATNGTGARVDHALLDQPEATYGRVRAVTIARTVEDLLLDGNSLWQVVLRTGAGFPQAVRRVPYGEWHVDDAGRVTVGQKVLDPRDAILFESPNDPLLVAGARAIRALLLLEKAAALYASEPEPSRSWRATDGVDPDDETVLSFLTAWVDARKKRATAFIPSMFEPVDLQRATPEQLQLISAREFAVSDIARLTGVDAEELSVSTTSRTYANIQQRRQQFVDFVLAPYLMAVEQRLSLPDATPRGQVVRFSLDAFLRADTGERYASYQTALTGGWLTLPEVRALEDLPPLDGTP